MGIRVIAEGITNCVPKLRALYSISQLETVTQKDAILREGLLLLR